VTFAGRVALVTGASSGLGAAVATELARHGAAVVLAARRLERLEELAATVVERGGRARAVRCDVTVEADVHRAVALACEAFGRLDVVVASAGVFVPGGIDAPLPAWRRQIETNVLGVVTTARAAMDALARTRGCLAVIGSTSGHVAWRGLAAYAASKFAVRAFCDGARAELEARGVAVLLVNPGAVATGFGGVAAPRFALAPDVAARRIVRAVAARRREVTLSVPAKLALIAYYYVPGMRRALAGVVDRVGRLRHRRRGDGPRPG
jgi:NADP-dependent 3-hydroxy acid dehydrogenase YdfG